MRNISRRDLIKLGLAGGAAALILPSKGLALGGTPYVTPFSLPFRVPPVLNPVARNETTDFYEISMQAGVKEMIPGLQTPIWGYNGIYPGPTIKARKGRTVQIRQTNNLPGHEHVTVHLHGGHTPASSDGHPNDMIHPGQFRDYIYPNDQRAATLWYHDHAMDTTGRNVYRGLAGMYIVSDDYEETLPLPTDRFDIPLLIQDRTFNTDGSLYYTLTAANGFQGDTLLVNGVIQPFFHVERKKYRFRVLNGSNSRRYELALSNGDQFIQIGSDQGLLSAPLARNTIGLQPAERVDVIIDFAQMNPGTEVVLNNTLGTGRLGQVMQFRVMPRGYGKWGHDKYSIPSSFEPIVRIPESAATQTRNFVLGAGMGTFTINGLIYDGGRIDANPALNSTEIWVFQNNMNMHHPMHIHDIAWQILDVNGSPPPVWDMGWKDTFKVGPMETVRVIGKFIDYTGDFMFHCHNLEHEDLGMMGQFRVS